mgnify:FL=1
MQRNVVFAGSFDPFTLGHLDIVRRASECFGDVYVLVAKNVSKNYMFSESQRVEMIKKAVEGIPNVYVDAFDGLTTEFMKDIGVCYLVRGIRNAADLDFEQSFAWNNKMLYPECETVFLSSAPEHLMISSTVVRELLKAGIAKGENGRKLLAKYVPEPVAEMILESGYFSNQ